VAAEELLTLPGVIMRAAPWYAVAAAAFVVTGGALIAFATPHGGGPPAPDSGAAASTRATPSRPAATGPARQLSPLGSSAAAYLASRRGTVSAAVYDLRTGRAWTLGPSRPQAEASVVKLDILETMLAEHEASHTGLSAAERSLAQQMIEDSDNDAATSLWYHVGGASGIGDFNTAAGLARTTPSRCVECAGFPWPGWGLTTTTPADQITLLRRLIQPSRLLTGADRGYALRLMENVTAAQRWGVTGGVPPRVTVALKNGWLPLNGSGTDWQINSVGWVTGRGRDYLLAVLSTRNPSERYGIDTVTRLAALVWAAMY
jgi:beta-lactamase class A